MNVTLDTSLVPPDREALKRNGAAKDFEALLIAQMLKSMREENTTEDQPGEIAMGLGEEQLAKALSDGGGLGLAKAIQSGIR